jgi:hypothetical protein
MTVWLQAQVKQGLTGVFSSGLWWSRAQYVLDEINDDTNMQDARLKEC